MFSTDIVKLIEKERADLIKRANQKLIDLSKKAIESPNITEIEECVAQRKKINIALSDMDNCVLDISNIFDGGRNIMALILSAEILEAQLK